MTQSPETGRSTRRLGWLRWVLLGSLALNLLVAGLVVGHFVSDGPDRRVPRVDRMRAPLTFALSPEDRHAIGRALRQEYRENRPSRSEIAAEYRNVISALREDPFDRSKLEVVFENQQSSAARRIEIGQRLLLERIVGMDASERRAFADRLEEGLERHSRSREDREKPDR